MRKLICKRGHLRSPENVNQCNACRACLRLYSKTDKARARISKYSTSECGRAHLNYKAGKRYRLRRRWLDYIKHRPCADCRMIFSPWVMHFDHRDPSTKFMSVSQMMCKPWKVLLDEVAKCDVVCANCHAERTHKLWIQRYNLASRPPLVA